MLLIRKYNSSLDERALRELVIELLDFEKSVEPTWPSGSEIIEPYFQWLQKRCREHSGEIFVADDNGEILGFITVLARVLPPDPDEYPREYAFISDFLVHAPYRRRGLGRLLIAEAEKFARQKGVSTIRLEASAGNSPGRQFYLKSGYREIVVEYFKELK